MYEYVDITNLCGCKGTTNIWNKQGFDEKKRIYLLFSGKIDIKKGEVVPHPYFKNNLYLILISWTSMKKLLSDW